MRSLLVILAVFSMLFGGLGACFKSSTLQASSESSSKSSSSPFRSSSRSSSPEKSFGEDVAEATRSWTLSGGDVAGLQHDISRLATDVGISDWESRRSSWEGVPELVFVNLRKGSMAYARGEPAWTSLRVLETP